MNSTPRQIMIRPRVAHPREIKTVAVSAGYMNPEPRAVFFAHMDAANIDLKAFTDRCCQFVLLGNNTLCEGI